MTTIADMPLNSSPVVTSVEALTAKRAAAEKKCAVAVEYYGGLVPGNAGEAVALLDAGVVGIKAFLCASGLDEFPPATAADIAAVGPMLAERNKPLLVHAEYAAAPSPDIVDVGNYREYLESRPAAWESDAIALLIDLCSTHRFPLHIVHLANGDALPMLAKARASGLPITVETCPHYLHFDAESIPAGATAFKCAPPIRESRHRELLWDGLRTGIIDAIGSDHSPCPPAMKFLDAGDFKAAWGGIASLQLMLPVVWTQAEARAVGLSDVFRWLSAAPARILQIPKKGQLVVGWQADLVVFDPLRRWVVHGADLIHRHKLTPYEGVGLQGSVERTYVAGHCVYRREGARSSSID